MTQIIFDLGDDGGEDNFIYFCDKYGKSIKDGLICAVGYWIEQLQKLENESSGDQKYSRLLSYLVVHLGIEKTIDILKACNLSNDIEFLGSVYK